MLCWIKAWSDARVAAYELRVLRLRIWDFGFWIGKIERMRYGVRVYIVGELIKLIELITGGRLVKWAEIL